MAAPTFVSYGASVFNTATSPKTVAISVTAGDRIVVMSLGENTASGVVNTAPTGGSETYTQVATLGTTASHARAIAWTATAASTQSYSVSCVRPMANVGSWWGCCVWVWRDSDGFGTIGAPTVNSTSNSVTLTTAQANSGLCVGSTDFAAIDGTSRTRRTVNGSTGTERSYFRDSVRYGLYAQDYADTGSVGSITAGYSAPASQVSAIIAVEVRGTSSAAVSSNQARPAVLPLPFRSPYQGPTPEPFQLMGDQSTPQSKALDDTAAAADALTVAGAIPLTDTGTGTDAIAVTVTVPLADTAAGADALSVAAAVPLGDDPGAAADAISVQVLGGVDANQAAPAVLPLPFLTPYQGPIPTPLQLLGDRSTPSSIPLDDTGTAADALSVTATAALADTATGADALAATVAVPLADTGSSTDALTVTVAVPLTDVGAGTDALSVTAAVPLDDIGTGVDALAITATVPLAETASGADALAITATVPLGDDPGTGTDSISVLAAGQADPNQAAPAVLPLPLRSPYQGPAPTPLQLLGNTFISGDRSIDLTDVGAATDALSLTAAVPLTETASGADSLSVTVTLPLADTGAAADTLTVAAATALAETGSGADALSVAAAVPLADPRTAVDALSANATVALADTAVAVDFLSSGNSAFPVVLHPDLHATLNGSDLRAVLNELDVQATLNGGALTATLNASDLTATANGSELSLE